MFILENSLVELLFILNFIRIRFSLGELKSNNFFEVRKVSTSS